MAGVILYRGASLIDGAPIVVVAVKPAGRVNVKTGNMLQTYIIREDLDPLEAVRTGADESVCGGCKHRGDGTGKGRTCYVTLHTAPLAVYRAYKRGAYGTDVISGAEVAEYGRDWMVRLGTYGDPLAAPLTIWTELTRYAAGFTGYTHQWKGYTGHAAKFLTMASVETEAEAREATKAGWRYYRVRPAGQAASTLEGLPEIDCPSLQGVQCVDCGLCSGLTRAKARSVSIELHGGVAQKANGARLFARLQAED